jgi:hypothetical protein
MGGLCVIYGSIRGLVEIVDGHSRFGGLCKINFNLYESTLHHTLYDVEYIIYINPISHGGGGYYSPDVRNMHF